MNDVDNILKILEQLNEKLKNINEDTNLDKLKEELKTLQHDLDDQE